MPLAKEPQEAILWLSAYYSLLKGNGPSRPYSHTYLFTFRVGFSQHFRGQFWPNPLHILQLLSASLWPEISLRPSTITYEGDTSVGVPAEDNL